MGQCASGRRVVKVREDWDGGVSRGRHGWITIVKEQRSRLYIVRKCVVILVCWHKYGNS
ncbi:conserved hypothetical protein [Ricinus communis]|uniref:Uncharacterized protein n=1 Tax=Ricinus communis TaxID=3988 RepID=B9SXC8_RICCO|nr:conserved hypothetical protein [Ricinus communis]